VKPTVIVLTKAPRIGAGKSRLAAGIGRVQAWRINRTLQALTFRRARDPRWTIVLCVAPGAAVRTRMPGVWPADAERTAQKKGDLGMRIATAMGARRGPVGVIGTDCTGLTRSAIAAVFAGLRRGRFAVGPAPDGGFWMLSARRGTDVRPIAHRIRWSSAHTLADIEASLGPLVRGPALADVDSVEDWRALDKSTLIGAGRAPRSRRVSPPEPDRALRAP
jgi:glycosyltransferase A (GT-A) superfamily protein (DUF2064 family)